jgi:hypothetical protein
MAEFSTDLSLAIATVAGPGKKDSGRISRLCNTPLRHLHVDTRAHALDLGHAIYTGVQIT